MFRPDASIDHTDPSSDFVSHPSELFIHVRTVTSSEYGGFDGIRMDMILDKASRVRAIKPVLQRCFGLMLDDDKRGFAIDIVGRTDQ